MEETTPSTPGAVAWPVFTLVQRRVLGVLVEKGKTTPDSYPLSVNSLTTGCNQKSARDPILDLSNDEVEQALNELQQQGLVTRIQGGRVERWKHNLYEQWNVGKVELAILGELLLRGPQTEGELRGRANRMEPIADLDTLRQALKPLAERKLIVYVGEEGRRGTLIAHGFHDALELEAVKARGPSEAAVASRSPQPSPLQADVEQLKNDVAQLRSDVDALRGQLENLKKAQGSASETSPSM